MSAWPLVDFILNDYRHKDRQADEKYGIMRRLQLSATGKSTIQFSCMINFEMLFQLYKYVTMMFEGVSINSYFYVHTLEFQIEV